MGNSEKRFSALLLVVGTVLVAVLLWQAPGSSAAIYELKPGQPGPGTRGPTGFEPIFTPTFTSISTSTSTSSSTPKKSQEEEQALHGGYTLREVMLVPTEVLLADYALLRASFPVLRGKSNEQIDRWLQYQAGFMRDVHLQAVATKVPLHPLPLTCWSSTPLSSSSFSSNDCLSSSNLTSSSRAVETPLSMIMTMKEDEIRPVTAQHLADLLPIYPFDCQDIGDSRFHSRFVLRKQGAIPQDSGRAINVPITFSSSSSSSSFSSSILKPYELPSPLLLQQYVDVKGSGTERPRNSSLYGNGVMSLDEALHEFLMEKAVSRIEQLESTVSSSASYGPRLTTVKTLAILTLPGLKIKNNKPLVLLIRQAVKRSPDYVADGHLQVYFERTLRKYGLTGLTHTFHVYYELSNRQCARVHVDMWRRQPALYSLTGLFDRWAGFAISRPRRFHCSPLFLDFQVAATPGQMIDFSVVDFIRPHFRLTLPEDRVYTIEQLYKARCSSTLTHTNLLTADQCLRALPPPIPLSLLGVNSSYHFLFSSSSSSSSSLSSSFSENSYVSTIRRIGQHRNSARCWAQLWPPDERDDVFQFLELPLAEQLAQRPRFHVDLFQRFQDFLATWSYHP